MSEEKPSYPKEALYYSEEQIAVVIDLTFKVSKVVADRGFNFEKMLKDRGNFKTIPTEAELKENKDNIAEAFENELWAIYHKVKL